MTSTVVRAYPTKNNEGFNPIPTLAHDNPRLSQLEPGEQLPQLPREISILIVELLPNWSVAARVGLISREYVTYTRTFSVVLHYAKLLDFPEERLIGEEVNVDGKPTRNTRLIGNPALPLFDRVNYALQRLDLLNRTREGATPAAPDTSFEERFSAIRRNVVTEEQFIKANMGDVGLAMSLALAGVPFSTEPVYRFRIDSAETSSLYGNIAYFMLKTLVPHGQGTQAAFLTSVPGNRHAHWIRLSIQARCLKSLHLFIAHQFQVSSAHVTYAMSHYPEALPLLLQNINEVDVSTITSAEQDKRLHPYMGDLLERVVAPNSTTLILVITHISNPTQQRRILTKCLNAGASADYTFVKKAMEQNIDPDLVEFVLRASLQKPSLLLNLNEDNTPRYLPILIPYISNKDLVTLSAVIQHITNEEECQELLTALCQQGIAVSSNVVQLALSIRPTVIPTLVPYIPSDTKLHLGHSRDAECANLMILDHLLPYLPFAELTDSDKNLLFEIALEKRPDKLQYFLDAGYSPGWAQLLIALIDAPQKLPALFKASWNTSNVIEFFFTCLLFIVELPFFGLIYGTWRALQWGISKLQELILGDGHASPSSSV